MLVNLQSIIIDKPIPGLTGVAFNKCTTLADVLAALIGQSGADIHATSGSYDPATETIGINLSNGGSFTIPASLLLPVVADGVTITGNGTNTNKLVGYQVASDAATGALTITPPTGAAVTVPAQTATEEQAADPHNLLGLGVGATVTTQQLLDYLAVRSHAPVGVGENSNPALTVDPATQLAVLDLSAPGSFDNSGTGLGADNLQAALTELAHCCANAAQTIPATAFADPANPTQAEADAWAHSNGPFGTGTLLLYPGSGTITAPDYVWQLDQAYEAITVERPTIPQTAASEPATDTNNLLGGGAGATVTTQQLLDYLAAHLRDCCPSDTLEIPASAFADPVNPTQLEAQAWIDNQGPLRAGTPIIYNRFGGGDVADPDYVWLVNELGNATKVESPAPIRAGASLINATATGMVQNIAKNPAFSQIAYQQNATAATGANSSITIHDSGRYLVNASVWWASETWTHECGMHGLINVNGAIVRAGGRLDHSRKLPVDPVNGGAAKFLAYSTEMTCILPLVAGDVVTFTVIHDDITAHNLLTNAGYSWFQVEKLS